MSILALRHKWTLPTLTGGRFPVEILAGIFGNYRRNPSSNPGRNPEGIPDGILKEITEEILAGTRIPERIIDKISRAITYCRNPL